MGWGARRRVSLRKSVPFCFDSSMVLDSRGEHRNDVEHLAESILVTAASTVITSERVIFAFWCGGFFARW